MIFFDYVGMATRNLLRQKTRTILTIVAITVGSLSLILMASIIISIKQSLGEQFKQLGAFDLVTVIKDPNSINNNSLIGNSGGDPAEGKAIDETTLVAMQQLPHVVKLTPIISNFGISTMRLDGQERKTWASIVAYNPNNDVFDLPIAVGRKLTTGDLDSIVVGNRFVEDMGYKGPIEDLIGKKVMLNYRDGGGGSAPDWGPLPLKPPMNASRDWYDSKGKIGVDIPAVIIGITKSGALDDGQSYISLGWARRLMTTVSWQHQQCQPNQPCSDSLTLIKDDNFIRQGYGSIILKVDDTANINVVADSVKKLGYGATTAQAMLDQINKILGMISIVLAVIGGISLFVATIGIVNTMIMATYERTREIGVLRACGATRATIRWLFIIEAASLGFWGGICGLIISLGLGQIAKYFVGKHGANLGSLPIEHIGHFPWWLIILVIIFTTFVGAISGLFPAVRAARLNPVVALRYE